LQKKLCFFLNKIQTPFEGTARPFINWAIGFQKTQNEVHFILLNCDSSIGEFIEKGITGIKVKDTSSIGETVDYIANAKPDIIITDDYFARLKLITEIKNKVHIRTCIYVQVLHSVHSISESFHLQSITPSMKILYGIIKVVPFNLLKRPYKNLLLKHDIIIANSQITATLLHTLYGIEPYDVIYPPLNTKVFKFHTHAANQNQEDKVLIYLGSHPDDTDANFIREICAVLQNKGSIIALLGNSNLQKQLEGDFDFERFADISDEQLAKIYSESSLTICPQKWETFGYVVAESICCGTPVLAFNCMGLAEIITQTQIGFLANNEKEFIKKINQFAQRRTNFQPYAKAKFDWDIVQSTTKLQRILEEQEIHEQEL
jgi:glycosyltransferase involved in cell wall biosynthesis